MLESISRTKVRILRSLKAGPRYGYQISMELDVPLGSVYGHLKTLTVEGLIVRKGQRGRSGTPRFVYKLTSKGELLVRALE
ncbi:MAG: helix-turn-helix transcriptional regulator [Euryarchaeota archaeon]|nr:helix-turn-helix transcriptional regulator [Euryarchaeota archaeon]